ncbi:hypothetical protein [Bacillus phage CP-51]|uniref:Uncharacterized protein n=1 Tax=Bacillus phage CP-51 TaxID=1391188 RepID=A0A068EPE1_9CAUD|nr:hypothetical protein OZ73_gp144 [Bacillus phage CP-51]AID50579.1 hypothetical protein [Bacillus phage CP-51]
MLSANNDKDIQKLLNDNCNVQFIRIVNGEVRELCMERFGKAFVIRFVPFGQPLVMKPEYSVYKVGMNGREIRVAAFFTEELEDNIANFGFREGMLDEWHQTLLDNPSARFYNSNHTFFIARTPESERGFKHSILP